MSYLTVATFYKSYVSHKPEMSSKEICDILNDLIIFLTGTALAFDATGLYYKYKYCNPTMYYTHIELLPFVKEVASRLPTILEDEDDD